MVPGGLGVSPSGESVLEVLELVELVGSVVALVLLDYSPVGASLHGGATARALQRPSVA